MNRTLALWFPDWPVVAIGMEDGIPVTEPLVVVRRERVRVCSAAARRAGIRRGLRRREAQSRIPGLRVEQEDVARDARHFEPVIDSLAEVAAGIEVLRPGLAVVGARGVARFHGGEDAAAEAVIDAVAVAGADVLVGYADDVSTAVWAARAGVRVPPGGNRAFLDPLPVATLTVEPTLDGDEYDELVGLLPRLGVHTLGAFAGMESGRVAARFGARGAAAHRLARGADGRGALPRPAPPDRAVRRRCEPPLRRVDVAAFVARGLATELHVVLADTGGACTRLAVRARLADGRELERVWRCVRPLTAEETADRVRWQLDGWLTRARLAEGDAAGRGGVGAEGAGRGGGDPDGGIAELELAPLEVVAAGLVRRGLFDGPGGVDEERAERARRAVVRVQALLGPDSVQVPVAAGGRGPEDVVERVPAGEERVPRRPAEGPWRGRIPPPHPAVLAARPVEVVDSAGGAVTVSGRGLLSAPPALLRTDAEARPVVNWCGPWTMDERWWEEGENARRGAWMQVLPASGPALLLWGRAGVWEVRGEYV